MMLPPRPPPPTLMGSLLDDERQIAITKAFDEATQRYIALLEWQGRVLPWAVATGLALGTVLGVGGWWFFGR